MDKYFNWEEINYQLGDDHDNLVRNSNSIVILGKIKVVLIINIVSCHDDLMNL